MSFGSNRSGKGAVWGETDLSSSPFHRNYLDTADSPHSSHSGGSPKGNGNGPSPKRNQVSPTNSDSRRFFQEPGSRDSSGSFNNMDRFTPEMNSRGASVGLNGNDRFAHNSRRASRSMNESDRNSPDSVSRAAQRQNFEEDMQHDFAPEELDVTQNPWEGSDSQRPLQPSPSRGTMIPADVSTLHSYILLPVFMILFFFFFF